MDRYELDTKMTDVAKTLLSYCIARTSNHLEAEDLAQEIIVEVYKSADNLRNEDAFYSFMWAVAGNMYKQWCKKKAQNRECELTENVVDESEFFEGESSELYLLRRELTLLNEKYRKAVILYYVENKSCSQISNILSMSESMVKYLLFKSRQILKEGMNMERSYGQQSYNPKGLSIGFWGNGSNYYHRLCESKISQNILFACYNDKLSAEQISLEIGVALPYMEDKLQELCEYDVLKKDGNRYYTNIVIFTRDFAREVNLKTMRLWENLANILSTAVKEHEKEVRAIGFVGADMSNNSFAWQMVSFILRQAVIEKFQDKIELQCPTDKFGTECFVWGVETGDENSWRPQFGVGMCQVRNKNGNYVNFMDFPINGKYVHHYFYNNQNVTNVFLDIAQGQTAHFSENDKAIVADLIRQGYVLANEKGLFVNVPIFTKEQYEKLKDIFAETVTKMEMEAEGLLNIVAKILKNHVPVHLKKMTQDMAYLHLSEDVIAASVGKLYEQKYLLSYKGDSMLPTTYVVI